MPCCYVDQATYHVVGSRGKHIWPGIDGISIWGSGGDVEMARAAVNIISWIVKVVE